MIDAQMAGALRDRFFVLHENASDEERQAFRARVDAVEAPPTTELRGLSLSYFPSVRFKQLRFIEAEHLDDQVRPLFARPCRGLPHLAAAFVDPEEFSYHSFENIVCLDRWFEDVAPSDVRLGRYRRRHRPIRTHAVHLPAHLQERLHQLDQLGLHVPPLNAASRGGTRFIFHAAPLATALTEAVRAALPKRLLRGFSHVNPVFRCNRFEPGDARFQAHVDSPYRDPNRHHVSKYTLLIYLTGGHGDALLRFANGAAIDRIAPMTAVFFEQHEPHDGGPFAEGRKVFLRTELVFEDRALDHDPGLSQMFAQACYLTGESVFAPELARFTHELYDRAALAHWRGIQEPRRSHRFVHKRFRDVEFIANGYDFWFPKNRYPLPECAAITLLDVLNAKVGEHAFRKQCTTTVIGRQSAEASWIAARLQADRQPSASPQPIFARLDPDTLLPAPEAPERGMGFPSSPDFHDDPFPSHWDATRHPDVVEILTGAQEYARKRIFGAPIALLGQELFLQPEHFVVAGNRIFITSTHAPEPVHFAGAQFYYPINFIGVEVGIDAPQLLVPPILYRETEDLFHLMFDLFRNGWMVAMRPVTVPVPRIIDDPEADAGWSPWWSAAAAESDYDTVRQEVGFDH